MQNLKCIFENKQTSDNGNTMLLVVACFTVDRINLPAIGIAHWPKRVRTVPWINRQIAEAVHLAPCSVKRRLRNCSQPRRGERSKQTRSAKIVTSLSKLSMTQSLFLWWLPLWWLGCNGIPDNEDVMSGTPAKKQRMNWIQLHFPNRQSLIAIWRKTWKRSKIEIDDGQSEIGTTTRHNKVSIWTESR